MVYAILLTQVVTFLLTSVELRSAMIAAGLRFIRQGIATEIRPLASFAIPAFMASSIVVPVTWLVNVLLVKPPDGYSGMGVFNAANQWRMAVLFIPLAFGNVVLPILSSLVGVGDERQYRRVLMMNIGVSAAVSGCLILMVWIFSLHIMDSYGPAFEGGSRVLRVLIVAAGLAAVNNVIGQAIASLGRMWHGFGFNALWAIALTSGAYILSPKYGALGLAIAYVAAYGLHTAAQFIYLYINIGTRGRA